MCKVAATAALLGATAALRKVGSNKTGGPAGQGKPHVDLLGETYWSQGALRYGDHVAKVSAAPVSEELTARTGEHVTVREPSAQRDRTARFFGEHGGTWEFR